MFHVLFCEHNLTRKDRAMSAWEGSRGHIPKGEKGWHRGGDSAQRPGSTEAYRAGLVESRFLQLNLNGWEAKAFWANQLKVGALLTVYPALEKRTIELGSETTDTFPLGVEEGGSPSFCCCPHTLLRRGMMWDLAHFLRSHVSLCLNKVKISTINLQSKRNPRGRQNWCGRQMQPKGKMLQVVHIRSGHLKITSLQGQGRAEIPTEAIKLMA